MARAVQQPLIWVVAPQLLQSTRVSLSKMLTLQLVRLMSRLKSGGELWSGARLLVKVDDRSCNN